MSAISARGLPACARVALIAAFLLFLPHLAFALAKMHTPGQFDVSPSGAATYTIPIEVPPGTAGMQPSLTLDYSSQKGNGFLGQGWSLGGLSVIHRCGATIATDGYRGGISYTVGHSSGDRFCLDGQKLVVVNGLTYGAHGAEYRTERDSYAKITSFGVAGNGPQYFEVRTKSGQILEYGNTANSRILPLFPTGVAVTAAQTASVRVWAVNRISDRAGNFMTFTYSAPNGTGAHYPERIDYTGNTNAGTATYASVRFFFQSRTDTTPQFVGQGQVQFTNRLSEIETYVGAARVKQYQVRYAQGPSTARSQVASVQEFAGDGAKSLPATTFEYQAGGGGIASTPTARIPFAHGADWRATYALYPGDFNGDGVTDIIRWNFRSGAVAFCAGPGIAGADNCVSVAGVNWGTSDRYSHLVGDFNADGIADILRVREPFGGGLLCPGPGVTTSSNCVALGNISKELSSRVEVGDFNGDGAIDLFMFTSGGGARVCYGPSFSTCLSTSVGLEYVQDGAYNGYGTSASAITVGDFDGDGKDDVIYSYQKGAHCQACGAGPLVSHACSSGTVCTPTTLNVLTGYTKLAGVASDFNGDGYTDLLGFRSYCLGPLNFSNPRCAPFYPVSDPHTATDPINFVMPGDFTGDGVADIIFSEQRGTHTVWICKGPGFLTGTACQRMANEAWNRDGIYPGDFNGDGSIDIIRTDGNGPDFIAGGTQVPDLLTKVTSGLGAATRLNYAPANAVGGVYSKDIGAVLPVQNFAGPLWLVGNTYSANGIGSEFHKRYRYIDARVHVQGHGFLGFRAIDVYSNMNPVTGLFERHRGTQFRQDFPCVGKPFRVIETGYAGGLRTVKDSSTEYGWGFTFGTAKHCYATRSTESNFELNGVAGPTVTTTYSAPDAYGNVADINVSTTDGHAKTTKHAYNAADTTHWILGRLNCSVVTATSPGGVLTRTSSFAYNANGFLQEEVVEPATPCRGVALQTPINSAQQRLTTTYGYDSFGNRISVQVTSAAAGGTLWYFAPRTTTTTYDAQGRFITSVKNALNQTEAHAYDPRWGTQTSLIGPNSLTTSWIYDEFGRLVREDRADGTNTTHSYAAVTHAVLAYTITTTATGQPARSADFDKLDRNIRNYVNAPSGVIGIDGKDYDPFGRVAFAYRNYFTTQTSYLGTTFTYDVLDRPKVITNPDNSTKTYTYHGYGTDDKGVSGYRTDETMAGAGILTQTTRTFKNSQGQTAKVVNAFGTPRASSITYVYDPFGSVKTTTDQLGNVITMSYNTRGHKIGMVDPDMGNWGYAYNALGELVEQSDPVQAAKALATTKFTYDVLGRLIQRVEPDLTSNWYYDKYGDGTACVKGIGKLCEVTATGAATYGNTGVRRLYTYDGFGRESNVAYHLDDHANPYNITKAYDSASRVATITYPSVTISSVASRFAVKHVYDASGYLSEIRDNASNTLYWRGDTWNADLNVTKETIANGVTTNCRVFDANFGRMTEVTAYKGDCRTATGVASGTALQRQSFTYDSLGNLKSRVDNMQSPALSESFGYDELNRLTSTNMSGPTTQARSYQYDAIGNLTYKSEIGTLNYAGANGGTRPHALTSVTGSIRGIVNPTFTYDANGNLITSLARSRTTSYFSFNKPNRINHQSSITDFYYDADHNRIRESNVNGVLTFVNPGNTPFFEKNILGTTITYRHFINGPTGSVAVWTRRSTGTNDLRYMHKDHLGSIVAESSVSGTVLARYSFDAWGKQRNVNGSDMTINPLPFTRRGFTGHEYLSEAGGLTHMNGRIYDPVVGRFMSADFMVPGSENSQAYNRYSYVYNNPLSLTDPDGQCPLCIVGLIVGTAAAKAIATTAIVEGIIAGVVSGAIAGEGDPRAILQGAVSGGIFGAAHNFFKGADFGLNAQFAGKVAFHAVAGGAINSAFGGDFRAGALSAGVAAVGGGALEASGWQVDSAQYAVARVVMGGIAAELGGGKFANGAATAAFGYLMNDRGGELEALDVDLDANCCGSLTNAEILDGIGDALILTDFVNGVPGDGALIGGALKSVAKKATPAATGLTTPSKYFGSKTKGEATEALTKKFGPAKSSREEASTFYNEKTKRSFNVHEAKGHMDGKPHVDVRRRGNYAEKKYMLKEGK